MSTATIANNLTEAIAEAIAVVSSHNPNTLTDEAARAIEDYEFRFSDYADDPDWYPTVSVKTPVDVSLTFCDEVTFSLEDGRSKHTLLWGECAHLAWTAHQTLRVPFAVFTAVGEDEEGGWSGHVGLKVGEGLILDATGVRTYAEIVADYTIDLSRDDAIREVDEDEFKVIQGIGGRSFEDYYGKHDTMEREWLSKMALDMLHKHLPSVL